MAFNKGLPKQPKQTETVVVQPPVPEPVPTPITDEDLLPAAATVAKVAAPAELSAPMATGVISMTPADIAAIVEAAVKSATAATAVASTSGNESIAAAITSALSQHMGPRRLTVADIGEPKTPFNPQGRKRELKHDFYHNGNTIFERFVSDGEIEMLHQIVAGSYGPPDFPIVVTVRKTVGGKDRVHITYRDGKDDRLKIKNYAPTFHQLLIKLVQEAKDQKAQRRAEARALLADE